MGRILENAEKAFLKQCSEACEAAVRQSAKEIKTDFKKRVIDKTILDYYNDYRPSRYKRIRKPNGLYKAFNVNTSTSDQEITLTYDWDFNRLPQYKSNSKYHKSGKEWISRYDSRFNWDEDEDGEPKGNNGIPEKGWIFTNFMEGIHPRFYVDNDIGIVVDESERFEPSYLRIKKYQDDYINGGRMRDILIKNLKIQYRRYK